MSWNSRRRERKQRELDEEILAHFEIEVQRRIGNGETPQAAEEAARRQFGNIGLVKEVTRDMWGRGWVDALVQDLKIASRTMRKTLGFTTAAVLTVALGVGAATAMFSVVNGILLRPLPYPHAERIAMLWRLAPVSSSFGGDEYPWGKFDFGLFRSQTKTFASLGAFQGDAFNLTGSGEPVFLEGMRASSGFFPALGSAPTIGRWFTEEEDRPGREHVVVLGDRVWRDHFGANRNIVGQAIQLNGFSYTVIGIMPPGFSFPHAEDMPAALEFPREAQLWVPLAIPHGAKAGPNELAVIGGMRPGRSLSQAQAELDVFAHTFAEAVPAAKEWSRSRAVSLKQQIVGDVSRPLMLFLYAVGLVLVIACSNVASLVFTRSLGRRREVDLRTALGASYGRLLRQLLTENLLLASIGGVLGILLAQAAIEFVKNFGPANLPRLQEIGFDPTVFAFCAGVTLFAGLGFGLMPALGSARTNLAASALPKRRPPFFAAASQRLAHCASGFCARLGDCGRAAGSHVLRSAQRRSRFHSGPCPDVRNLVAARQVSGPGAHGAAL